MRQLLTGFRHLLAGRSAKSLEKGGTRFGTFMLRVVKRAVLSQCWFHLNSPVRVRRDRIDAGADIWAICVEARDIRIHRRHESYP